MPVSVVHFSGGKDSTAMLLRAIEHRNLRPSFEPMVVFADTQHEAPETYDYVDRISDLWVERTGLDPVIRVKADFTHRFKKHRDHIRTKWPELGISDEVVQRALAVNKPTGNAFLDMCVLKAGFPAPRARFCTNELKIRPTHQQVFEPIWKRGGRIIAWRGLRADESFVRREVPRIQTLRAKGPLKGYHPIKEWTVEDVWKMHRRHGVEPNTLYAQGLTRVGCFPCIMSRKSELRTIADRFPEAIDKLEEWERIVGEGSRRVNSIATFFQVKSRVSGIESKDIDARKHGIRDAVKWSRTVYGGKQYDLLPLDDVRADLLTACDAWGACE